jgi:tetratricopeptide (TPR) repeat protein
MLALKNQEKLKDQSGLRNWRELKSWRPYFIFFLFGILLYGQTLFFDYTYFDDSTLILEKIDILSNFSNVSQIFSTDAFFSNTKFYYRPLLNLSFMIDAQASGILPIFYHLSNVIFHCLAAGLVFCLLNRVLKRRLLAFYLSLVFLVHPVLTPAVAWLPGRNDSLLTIFVLLSFISFLNFLAKPRLRTYFAYLLFFWLALLSKESAIVLPFLVIFYFLFLEPKKILSSDRFLLIFGSAATAAIWLIMRSLALGGDATNYLQALLGIIHNSAAFLIGLGKIILPFNLSVLPILADSSLVFGLLALAILLAAWFFSRARRNIYLVFGLLWFFVFLAPSFIRLNALPDFLEHRIYLPLVGFLIALAEIDWLKNLDFKKRSVKIGATLILIIFAALTFSQSLKFKDRLIFWQTAAKDSPHSPLAQRNLGVMYYFAGQNVLAVKHYRLALNLNPQEEMAHNNLGVIYLNEGNYSQAEKEFKAELIINPNYDKALFNLGDVYYRTQRFPEAANFFWQALRVNPTYGEAYERWLILQNRLR